MPPLVAILFSLLLAAPAADRSAIVVNAPDAPIKMDRATILTAAEGPPVLFYAATNQTGDTYEVLTVTAFVFDAQGVLKARQMAPGRRTLNPHETKYSTLVIDGEKVLPTDIIVAGINQAQRADNEQWWRAEIEAAATAAAAGVAKKK